MSLKIIVNVFYQPSKFLSQLMELDGGRLYYPINGGCSLKDQNPPKWLYFDDSGDSISKHNHALNEMTSIYWFWKNYDWKSLDYVGFNHYRRLFDPKDFADYKDYDLIVMKPYQFRLVQDIEDQYKTYHYGNDFDILCNVLQKYSIFLKDFKEYCKSKTFVAPCNMFIMKSHLFDMYCTFMFPLLMQLMNYVNLSSYNKYQHRAIAFLSERLTSWWVSKQMRSMKVKQIPVQFKL